MRRRQTEKKWPIRVLFRNVRQGVLSVGYAVESPERNNPQGMGEKQGEAVSTAASYTSALRCLLAGCEVRQESLRLEPSTHATLAASEAGPSL
jgi:hypothetical protein